MKDDIVDDGRWNLFVSVSVFEERPGSLRSHEICVCRRTVRGNDTGNDAVRQENSPTPAICPEPHQRYSIQHRRRHCAPIA